MDGLSLTGQYWPIEIVFNPLTSGVTHPFQLSNVTKVHDLIQAQQLCCGGGVQERSWDRNLAVSRWVVQDVVFL